MVKLVAFLKRREGMTRDEFYEHWEGTHGPLIRSTPELARHIVRYEQHRRVPEPTLGRHARATTASPSSGSSRSRPSGVLRRARLRRADRARRGEVPRPRQPGLDDHRGADGHHRRPDHLRGPEHERHDQPRSNVGTSASTVGSCSSPAARRASVGRRPRRSPGSGASVMVADRDEVHGDVVVAAIRAAGGEARFVRVDVAEPDQIRAMVAAVEEEFGRLDVAVNNAGMPGHLQALQRPGARRLAAHARGEPHRRVPLACRPRSRPCSTSVAAPSSTWRRPPGSWASPTCRPTWPASTASSASPRAWRSSTPARTSASTRCAPATSTRRCSRASSVATRTRCRAWAR